MSRDDIWTAILLALGPPPNPDDFWTVPGQGSWFKNHDLYVNKLVVQIAIYQPRALAKAPLTAREYLQWCEEIRNGDQA